MKKKYSSYDLDYESYSYEELLDMLSLHRSRCLNRHWKAEGVRLIRTFALQKLLKKHSNPILENNPIKEGAELVIVGKSSFVYNSLKKRLAVWGIRVATKVTKTTTHVLLGLNPTTTKGLENEEVTFLEDRDLQEVLDELEKPYLKEKENEASVEQLESLLMSADNQNIMIAAQLMQGGGFPSQLINATFIALRQTKDKAVRKAIRGLLLKNVSEETKEALRIIKLFHVRLEEYKLERNLVAYTDKKSELDGDEIAKLMYKYHKVCVQYIFTKMKDRDFAKQVLEDYIDDNTNTLDLSGLGLSKLPKELAEYTQLENVILAKNRFKTIRLILTKLNRIQYLDISSNKIQQLNKAIEKMPTLEYLNIAGNANRFIFDEIDALKLQKLAIINLQSWFKDSPVLPLLQAKVPHVKFTFD